MDKTAPVLEPPSVNRARTAYKYIRLSENAILNLAVKEPLPTTRPPPSERTQPRASSSRDASTAERSTGLSNVNGGEKASRGTALEPASNSPQNDLSITFVPCGYLLCTKCYEFPAPGNPNIAMPRPSGFRLSSSDVSCSDMESSDQSDCFEESESEGRSSAEEDEDGSSEFSDHAGNGAPCIGKVVQGNLIGAGGERGNHEGDDTHDASGGEGGSDWESTLSDASTSSSSGDEYVPTQTATTRKARGTAAARSGRRLGRRR